MGRGNVTSVLLDSQQSYGLLDTGVQISNISEQWCLHNNLDINHISNLVKFEGTWGHEIIVYINYVVVHLNIWGNKTYDSGILLLLIQTIPYHEKYLWL